MSKVSYIVLNITLLLLFSACFDSADSNQLQPEIKSPVDEVFPKSWTGKYLGDLKIYGPEGLKQNVKMGLNVLPTSDSSVYKWVIIYGEGEDKQERNYELKAIDQDKGHFLIDEKNDIVINTFLIDNTLFNRFQVGANDLQASYSKIEDQIHYSIMISDTGALEVSGGTSDDIPPVRDFKIKSSQRAQLKLISE